MKLVNIADEGAKYKWQLYDLYDKAFPEQEKKPLQVMENLVADGKMEMLAMVDEDEFVGLGILWIGVKRPLIRIRISMKNHMTNMACCNVVE